MRLHDTDAGGARFEHRSCGRCRASALPDRSGALRRRCARHRPCRRAQGDRGTAGAGRLHRRRQHGVDRRRGLRERHDTERDGTAYRRPRPGRHVPRHTAAAGAVAVSQGARRGRFLGSGDRLQRRQGALAPGGDRRRRLAPVPERAGHRTGRRKIRQPVHSLSRGRDRHRDRRDGGAQPRRAVEGDARQHVDSRRGHAGGGRRSPAAQWRAGSQPAGRCRPCDGCRARDRRQCRLETAEARRPPIAVRGIHEDGGHPDGAERPRLARAAQTRSRGFFHNRLCESPCHHRARRSGGSARHRPPARARGQRGGVACTARPATGAHRTGPIGGADQRRWFAAHVRESRGGGEPGADARSRVPQPTPPSPCPHSPGSTTT